MGWSDIWVVEEANHLFPGMTQGVAVLGITAKAQIVPLLSVQLAVRIHAVTNKDSPNILHLKWKLS